MPIWSPDGQTVAFATSRSGALDIYQRPSDASRADEPLLKLGASNLLLSDWSLDGRFLTYYLADPKTQLDVWVLPLFGDRKPFPFLHQPFNEFQGQFSPDGKWMAYVTDDESGHRNVFVQSFPQSTGKLQISADAGGTQPRWRRDGRELFYLAEDRKLMAVAIKTTATLEAETPKVLFETTRRVASPTHTYAVSADGQRFLLNRPADGASPRDQPWGDEPRAITVVLNWSGLLKR